MNSQEKFWSKKFGDDYVKRNVKVDKSLFIGKNLIKNKIKIKSAIEFGANIGLNLKALMPPGFTILIPSPFVELSIQAT